MEAGNLNLFSCISANGNDVKVSILSCQCYLRTSSSSAGSLFAIKKVGSRVAIPITGIYGAISVTGCRVPDEAIIHIAKMALRSKNI